MRSPVGRPSPSPPRSLSARRPGCLVSIARRDDCPSPPSEELVTSGASMLLSARAVGEGCTGDWRLGLARPGPALLWIIRSRRMRRSTTAPRVNRCGRMGFRTAGDALPVNVLLLNRVAVLIDPARRGGRSALTRSGGRREGRCCWRRRRHQGWRGGNHDHRRGSGRRGRWGRIGLRGRDPGHQDGSGYTHQ
jgi:hypothetical protein